MSRDRPKMPESYGVGDPQYGFEPIAWSWVSRQMSEGAQLLGGDDASGRKPSLSARVGRVDG